MKIKPLWIVVILSFLLSGCAGTPHIIGYGVIKSPLSPPDLGKLSILSFTDERPKQEHKGVKGKLLTFSSKDAHFSKEVSLAVEEVLAAELNNAGFAIVDESERPNYRISGSVKHFQAIASPSKITFLPYLGSLSTLWAKDEFTIAVGVYIKVTDRLEMTLIDKTFDVSEDMKLPTGLLNLARYSRGFNYKVKLLDEALKDVMGQIRDEIVTKTNPPVMEKLPEESKIQEIKKIAFGNNLMQFSSSALRRTRTILNVVKYLAVVSARYFPGIPR